MSSLRAFHATRCHANSRTINSLPPSPPPLSRSTSHQSCRRRARRRYFHISAQPPAAADGGLESLTDDELADLLGGPALSGVAEEELRRKVRARQEAKRASIEARHGDSLLKVEIGDPLDPFDCWLWFEAGGGGGGGSRPGNDWSPEDADLLDGVLTAWFMLGRLGGFNSENLQLSQGRGVASRDYDAAPLATAATAVFHDFSPRADVERSSPSSSPSEEEEGAIEVQGRWARAWVNLGSADELALDVLLNALATLAAEEVPALSRVIVGGELPWWPVPKVKDSRVGSREEGTEGVLPGDY